MKICVVEFEMYSRTFIVLYACLFILTDAIILLVIPALLFWGFVCLKANNSGSSGSLIFLSFICIAIWKRTNGNMKNTGKERKDG